ncbi:MAG: hypothetical protein JWM80_5845 [Cyanobacteria bacterium RYN_339]|nr:hypothetical protein [Cyanobacteria bacterium RYN_339]
MSYFGTIPERVTSTFLNWDKDKNGTIDYPVACKKKPCAGTDERTEVTEFKEKDKQGRDVTRELTMSIDKLVLGADRDHNGKVTPDELEALMRTFDKDGDNNLPTRGIFDWLTWKPKLEGDRFNYAYPTTVKNRIR